jgi:SAM-dependent methyltransferase
MILGNVLRAIKARKPVHRDSRNAWDAGLHYEIGFWETYIENRGGPWPKDFQARLDPHSPFRSDLCPYLDEVPGDKVRILDVGAGPMTILGKTHPTKQLEIIATDPLAPHYDRFLARHQIVPPVRTIAAAAEELTKRFPRNSFDMATAHNCLDHSYDPLKAIREMIAVIKPSRRAWLAHNENEADKQQWGGLHQWNFTVVDGDFVIRNRSTSINVTRELGRDAKVEVRSAQNGWIDILIQKRPA